MHLRAVLVTTVAAAVLAGCASGGSGAGPTTTAPSTDASTTAPGVVGSAAAGCGVEVEPVAPGRTVVEVASGGETRSYIRYVPEGYDASEPAPLVIDFTAYSPASLEESFSSFTQPDADGRVKADEVGAVVVTPEPVNGEGLLTWNTDGTEGWTDDQAFVTDLLDHVEATTCVDTERVLAMGFAIGAVMASTVACEQPERITALATVSGLWDPPACDPSEPTPVVSFVGSPGTELEFAL